MEFVIDRFEGDFAIIEDENKKMHKISKSALAGFSEGDVLSVTKIDKGGREERIKNLANELFG